jgi:methylmalonyl-CoA mutase C-terminal domain/subunit
VLKLLEENGQGHLPVVVGGIIPEQDAEQLRKMGVYAVYGPGTTTTQVVEQIRQAVAQTQAS